MVVKKSKKTATKKGTKYDEKSSLLLGKKALESRMQRRAKRDNAHKKRVNTAIILCAPLFASWMAAQMADTVADVVNENTKLEIALGIYGLAAVASIFLAMALEPLYSKQEAADDFAAEISELLKNKTADATVNRELVRLAPVFQTMTKQIALKNPEVSKSLMNGDVDAWNVDMVANAVREYLTKHPNDARKFLNLFTVAELPQQVIDFYIATYVPDTLSFSMAQKIRAGKGKGE